MLLSLIAVVVSQLSRCAASTLPCGGSQNVYVCNIHDPSKFDICIGEHKYTMSCPGGLHFNTLRQVCDWPQNADCGRPPQQHAPDPPRQAGDSRMVQREDADSNWRLQAHGAPSNKLLAEKEGPPSREDRWWNKGDESVSPDTGKGRDVAARDYSRHRSRENDINDDREVDDRFQLVHYPWWTSRGASPVALRNRFPMPVPGPRTPSRANDDVASRPGSEPRAQYRQALELNHRPAAPPRRKLQPPLPPPPGSQQVPQQQPLSASAPIAAAAASEPKRSKKPQKTGE